LSHPAERPAGSHGGYIVLFQQRDGMTFAAQGVGCCKTNDAAANDYDVGHRSSVAPQSLASWVQAASLEAFFFAAS
jgi:hypothetical protein